MAYVSRSSSRDFLEIRPDVAKTVVTEGRNLGVWIFSGPGRGWDSCGWMCIDVRIPKTTLFPYLGHLGISSGLFLHCFSLFRVSPWAPYWPLLAPIGSRVRCAHVRFVVAGTSGPLGPNLPASILQKAPYHLHHHKLRTPQLLVSSIQKGTQSLDKPRKHL